MKKIISLVLVLALCLAAGTAKADFTFGTPTSLGPVVNTSAADMAPSTSVDGLFLYFASGRAGGEDFYGDIWVAKRKTTNEEWDLPVNLGSVVNSSALETAPSISDDGLSLFFCDCVRGFKLPERSDGYGNGDLWVTTRTTKDDDWGPPVNLGPVINSSAYDGEPHISTDGLSLYFSSERSDDSNGLDLWVTTRATKDDDWGSPVNLGPKINSSVDDACPNISADDLALFFTSRRPGGQGQWDLWFTTRRTKYDDWGSPVNLGPIINDSGNDTAPEISNDGSTLYFCTQRVGTAFTDLWQASIEPVVDLNGDGIVDSADMCIMVDHWGTDELLCDIGPMPWGDGIVDVEDLIVLAEHLFAEIPPVE
jgi:Tol biopolymer transport system component